MPNIEELRRYSRETPDTTDEELTMYMEAAQIWYENAGVARLAGNRLYDLAVYMLASHWLDNKGVIADAGTEHTPLGVFSIMHQLRSTPPESEGTV